MKKEEMDEALAKNKRQMWGNIKFIGELFKLKVGYRYKYKLTQPCRVLDKCW